MECVCFDHAVERLFGASFREDDVVQLSLLHLRLVGPVAEFLQGLGIRCTQILLSLLFL